MMITAFIECSNLIFIFSHFNFQTLREHVGVNMENLDMKEMIYTQTQKDVAETKIHHLLSENLFMPKNRVSFLITF